MYRWATALVVMLATGPAMAGPDPRTQLERAAQISVEEAGKYSGAQLVLIKVALDKSDLSEGEKARRIRLIKEGTLPRFSLGLR